MCKGEVLTMEAIKLRDGFYWTGIIDDKLRVFDIVSLAQPTIPM